VGAVPSGGHVIICGLNHLGFRVVEQLRGASVPAVVVDDQADRRLLRHLRRLGVEPVLGPSQEGDTLDQAGLRTAIALIACEDSDLHNLETVLLARERRPTLRTVARIVNPQLADQVRDKAPDVGVIDVAAMSAPGFVEACLLETDGHAFDVDGESFEVRSIVADQDATVGGLIGHGQRAARALALRQLDGRIVPAPGAEAAVGQGETLSVIGPSSGFGADAASASVPSAASILLEKRRRRARRRVGSARATAAGLLAEVDRPIRWALAAVAALVLASTLLLAAIYDVPGEGRRGDFSLVDALYFTVTTVATAGDGSSIFGPAGPWFKAYGIGLIVAGALSVSLLYGFVTNLLISRRLADVLGRVGRTTLSGHVVVCGLGSIGLAVTEQLLAAGRPVVVIEHDDRNRFLARVRALKVPVVLGDATVSTTLRRANLAAATAVAVMTSDDQTNVETALTVRQTYATEQSKALPPVRVVLRLFDQGLAERVEATFDIHRARGVSALVAPHFLGAALDLPVVSTFYVGRQAYMVTRERTAGNHAGGPEAGRIGRWVSRMRRSGQAAAIVSLETTTGRLYVGPMPDIFRSLVASRMGGLTDAGPTLDRRWTGPERWRAARRQR
jgi:voltage-gated potassium channel Kch